MVRGACDLNLKPNEKPCGRDDVVHAPMLVLHVLRNSTTLVAVARVRLSVRELNEVSFIVEAPRATQQKTSLLESCRR